MYFKLEHDEDRRFTKIAYYIDAILGTVRPLKKIFIADAYFGATSLIENYIVAENASNTWEGILQWIITNGENEHLEEISIVAGDLHFRNYMEDNDYTISRKAQIIKREEKYYNGVKLRSNISGKAIVITLTYYPYQSEDEGRFQIEPRMHDRWSLFLGETESCGLHYGPSLNKIHNKDVLITPIDTVDKVPMRERFEHMCEIAYRRTRW